MDAVDCKVVNEIILELGVGIGPQHLRNTLYYLGKMSGWAKEFHPKLEKYREWMLGLEPRQADLLWQYAEAASSLAYRYLCKKNKKRRDKI